MFVCMYIVRIVCISHNYVIVIQVKPWKKNISFNYGPNNCHNNAMMYTYIHTYSKGK